MVSEKGLNEFKERLSKLPSIYNVAVTKIYKSQRASRENLIAVIPNLPVNSKYLRVINSITPFNMLDQRQTSKALDIFGEELIEEAMGDKHPIIQLLKKAIKENIYLELRKVETESPNLLESISNGTASQEEKIEGMVLMSEGKIKGAEKIYNFDGKGIWEPQQYAFDIIKKGLFTAFEVARTPNGTYDKIPMWDQDPSEFVKKGVGADRLPETEILKRKVRLMAPARFTAYLGPGTTVMQTAGLVNVGFYAEGEDTMIEGRASSLAQIGKRVKIGGGSGLVGVLSPDGSMPTILEDDVQMYAMCEAQGIVEKGGILASGTVMGDGKKIFDSRTGEYLPHRVIKNSEGKDLSFPYIPADRVAVPGIVIPNEGKALSNRGKKDSTYQRISESIILLEKNASEVDLANIPKNTVLYQR